MGKRDEFPIPTLRKRLIGTVYRAKDGGWRFRVLGRNGERIAQSESYTRKSDAKRGLQRLCPLAEVRGA